MKITTTATAICLALLAACQPSIAEVTDEQIAQLLGDKNNGGMIEQAMLDCLHLVSGTGIDGDQSMNAEFESFMKTQCTMEFDRRLNDKNGNPLELQMADLTQPAFLDRVQTIVKTGKGSGTIEESVRVDPVSIEEVRKINDVSLGMTRDEIIEVAKGIFGVEEFATKTFLSFTDETGAEEDLAMRIFTYSNVSDKQDDFTAMFASSPSDPTAYALAYDQPVSGQYTRNHHELWSSILEKYGNPAGYYSQNLQENKFNIRAYWMFDSAENVDPGTCRFKVSPTDYVAPKFNAECGTFVYISYKGGPRGNLHMSVVDHEVGERDQTYRLKNEQKSEAPKF